MLAFLLLTACDRQPPCQRDLAAADRGDRTVQIVLDEDAAGGRLVTQLILPGASGPRYSEVAPVAVHVPGGWQPDQVPLVAGSPRVLEGHGVVSLYPNLPGGEGEASSGGEDDGRGAQARAALAAVLRYAAGDMADEEECTLADRASDGLAGIITLAAPSNGGNLAWTTLADPEVDLPDGIVGVASFETPIGSQLITVEPGSQAGVDTLYSPGSCGLTAQGLVCDYGYPDLVWGAAGELLFADRDGDGDWTDGVDLEVPAIWSPAHDLWMQSVPAREAAEAAGLTLDDRATVGETAAFWAERDAGLAMSAAVARLPAIAGIVTGTEDDHKLAAVTDHAHVTGMVAAMQSAGVAWTRLHPDAAYMREATGIADGWAEQPADQAVAVGEDLAMEPAPTDGARDDHMLTAAALELLDRAWADEWSADLDAVLVE